MSDSGERKYCSRCKSNVPRSGFQRNRSTRDGLQAYCRECYARYYKERQEAKGKTVRAKVPVPRGSKRCPQCCEIKPHAEWERNKSSSDGWASYCRSCRAQRNKESYFRRKYGLTEAKRGALVAEQMGVCAICLRPDPAHIDHDHKTGAVRGVLCFNCNSALGKLRDDPEAFRRAIAYLEGNVWKPKLVAPGVYLLPS